jgi:hypothetical protein
MRKAVTIYLDVEPYQRLKELVMRRDGSPINAEVNELIKRRVAELEGRDPSEFSLPIDYEPLKKQQARLTREMENLRKILAKQGVYDRLHALVYGFGLDFRDYGNVEEVAAKLLGEWEGGEGQAHLFITLLETAREKRAVERKLAEVRARGVAAAQSVPLAKVEA